VTGEPVAPARSSVNLWLLDSEVASRAELDQAWQPLLSADERQRCHALRSERLRREFVAAHVLVRLVLSRYAPVEPAAWRFGRTSFGRPMIANAGCAHVCFSLSHTSGLVASPWPATRRWESMWRTLDGLSRRWPSLRATLQRPRWPA
jgi:4'-phosphopantetheinyl transferase